jgi:outer membrane protein TolC
MTSMLVSGAILSSCGCHTAREVRRLVTVPFAKTKAIRLKDSNNAQVRVAPPEHSQAPESKLALSSFTELLDETAGDVTTATEPDVAPTTSLPVAPVTTSEAEQPIDLGAALAMTAGQNPEVNFARQRVVEAFAQLQAAEVAWLPSIRAGANYNKHEGRIQDVAGQIIETSRGSVYSGLGAQAVGAGSPAVPGLLMNFHLRDALYQPRIAEAAVAARKHASRAVTNDLLMETAIAYVDLLEALQMKAVVEETKGNADELAKLTNDFAEAGQGLRADADRARAEQSFREIDLGTANESVRVASVRLSRLLRMDQRMTLTPVEPTLVPIEMVQLDEPVSALVSTGLMTRPELSEAKHLVRQAVEGYQRERFAPLVPSVLLGMSYGGNGGGLGSDIERYGDRMDFDAAAWWEVRNLGFGEKAAKEIACSRVEQARWQQLRTMDQVAAEVAEAHAQVLARRDQILMAQNAITASEESYRRNSERIRDAQGLPLEVLQSLQALDVARRRYAQIVADYNRSQFRLQRALGWPAEASSL